MKTFLIALASSALAGVLPGQGLAQAKEAHESPAAAPATGATSRQGERTLQVHGQTRNLSMMLVLKSDKDRIKFVEVRKDYRDKIPETGI